MRKRTFLAASLLFFLIIEWPYGGQGIAMHHILETYTHKGTRREQGT